MSGKIGIINEIGDMGLGFDELTESDQKKLEEDQKKEHEKQNSNTASKYVLLSMFLNTKPIKIASSHRCVRGCLLIGELIGGRFNV